MNDAVTDDLSQALGTFMQEAGELLAEMEAILLRAEAGSHREDDLNALFAARIPSRDPVDCSVWMKWCASRMSSKMSSIACATAGCSSTAI
jgi:hypothetical protein